MNAHDVIKRIIDSPDSATLGVIVEVIDATIKDMEALEARIKKLEDGHWQDRSDKYR